MNIDNNYKKVYSIEDRENGVDLSEYTHIKVYHACRPQNIDLYLKEGIHSFSREGAYQIVNDIFTQCGINEKEIVKCFNINWYESIHHFNQVCVNISKEELLQDSIHYLLYGSEFIYSMAIDLYCQHKLKHIGIPTIFECDVDIRKFTPETIEMIEDGSFFMEEWDGGIYLREKIDPNEIVRYFHYKRL